jgi:hypothetical protein
VFNECPKIVSPFLAKYIPDKDEGQPEVEMRAVLGRVFAKHLIPLEIRSIIWDLAFVNCMSCSKVYPPLAYPPLILINCDDCINTMMVAAEDHYGVEYDMYDDVSTDICHPCLAIHEAS